MGTQPLLKKGVESLPPIFGPCLLWQNGRMDQDGTWHGDGPWSRPHCIRRGQQLPLKGHSRPPSFRPMSIVGLWPRSPILATAELLLIIRLEAIGFSRILETLYGPL